MSTYPEEFSRLEKENKEPRDENERLRKAIEHIPTDEYNEALRNGCGPSGAWDTFLGELAIWRDQALK